MTTRCGGFERDQIATRSVRLRTHRGPDSGPSTKSRTEGANAVIQSDVIQGRGGAPSPAIGGAPTPRRWDGPNPRTCKLPPLRSTAPRLRSIWWFDHGAE